MEEFIPYGSHQIYDEDIAAVVEVLRSNSLAQGPVVDLFEQSVAQKVGSLFGVATNSATSALHLACLAVGLSPGDRLWTTSITFLASANCALFCNALVDFVDIDLQTGLMSVEALKIKLEQSQRDGTLPKVLIPVHLCGTSCYMKPIRELSLKFGFFIIEDASHAIGGSYDDQPVGNCLYSDITVFSFHPVKIITTGEGGMATTNSPKLAHKMRLLRSHGIERDRLKMDDPENIRPFEMHDLGYNYRMSDIQASLGLSQLSRLDSIVSDRNRLRDLYMSSFTDPTIRLLSVPSNVVSSVHLAVVCIEGLTKIKQKQLFQYMRNNHIGVQIHYSPVHKQPFYRNKYFSGRSLSLPQTDIYEHSVVTLPLYPALTDSQVVKVVYTLEIALREIREI